MNEHLVKEVQMLKQELAALRKDHKMLMEVQNTPVNSPIVDRIHQLDEIVLQHATAINDINGRLQAKNI